MSRYTPGSQIHAIALFEEDPVLKKKYFLIYFNSLALLLTACNGDESDACRASNLNVTDPQSVFGASCPTLGDWSKGWPFVPEGLRFWFAPQSARFSFDSMPGLLGQRMASRGHE